MPQFHTTILQTGKNTCGIQVPPEIVESLGQGKKPPVRITLKGYTYRTSVAVMDGVFMCSLSAENRANSGVNGGDELDVIIELDTEPREVTIPDDFAAALNADAEAKRFFETLSYSNKRRYILAIEAAKAAETRQKRIVKTIADLRAGKK